MIFQTQIWSEKSVLFSKFKDNKDSINVIWNNVSAVTSTLDNFFNDETMTLFDCRRWILTLQDLRTISIHGDSCRPSDGPCPVFLSRADRPPSFDVLPLSQSGHANLCSSVVRRQVATSFSPGVSIPRCLSPTAEHPVLRL